MIGNGMFFNNEILKELFGDFVGYNPSVEEQKCELVKTEEKPSTVSQSNEIWGSDEDHYFLNVGIPSENCNLDVMVDGGKVEINYSSETKDERVGFVHAFKSKGIMVYTLPIDAKISTLKAKKENGYLFLSVEKDKPTSTSFKVEIE